MSEIVQIINSVGFPVFVACWMLIKDSKEKEMTRKTLENLGVTIQKLCDRIDRENKVEE